VVIPDAGHIPQEETPAKITPLLREFLDQRGVSGRTLTKSSIAGAKK
jgi:hypothetical protein